MSFTIADAAVSSGTVASNDRDERRVNLFILCLMALGVGVMTGVGAVALRALIGLIHNAMINGAFKLPYDANILEGPSRLGNWVMLSPIIGGIVVIYLVERFAPEAKGHGVPVVAHRRELIRQANLKLTVAGDPHGIICTGFDAETPVRICSDPANPIASRVCHSPDHERQNASTHPVI